MGKISRIWVNYKKAMVMKCEPLKQGDKMPNSFSRSFQKIPFFYTQYSRKQFTQQTDYNKNKTFVYKITMIKNYSGCVQKRWHARRIKKN